MKLTWNGIAIEITSSGRSYTLMLGDKRIHAQISSDENGQMELLLDGRRVTAYVSPDGARRWVTVNGQTFVLTKSSGAGQRGLRRDQAGELAAPMPGQVRSLNVGAGDAVTKGQTLLVLEAMKMEIRIQAPKDGRVRALHVKQGQTVEREQVLIEIEEA